MDTSLLCDNEVLIMLFSGFVICRVKKVDSCIRWASVFIEVEIKLFLTCSIYFIF